LSPIEWVKPEEVKPVEVSEREIQTAFEKNLPDLEEGQFRRLLGCSTFHLVKILTKCFWFAWCGVTMLPLPFLRFLFQQWQYGDCDCGFLVGG
jgi:hypothetical protein